MRIAPTFTESAEHLAPLSDDGATTHSTANECHSGRRQPSTWTTCSADSPSKSVHSSGEPQAHSAAVSSQRLRSRACLISALTSGSFALREAADVEAVGELGYLSQREAGVLRGGDELQALERVVAIAALPAHAIGLGQQPDRLVVANRRGGQAGPLGQLSYEKRVLHLT